MKIQFLESEEFKNEYNLIAEDFCYEDADKPSFDKFKSFIESEITKLVEERQRKAIFYALKSRGIHGEEYDEIDVSLVLHEMKDEV